MTRRNHGSCWTCLAFSLTVLSTAQVFADVTTYTDQATFLSASGSTTEALMPASGSTTSQVVGGMTFTNDPPSTLSWGFVNAPFTNLTPGNDLAISGVEDYNVDFTTPITSIGFDWVDITDPQDTTFTVNFYSGGAGGTLVDSATFSGPDNQTLLFQGFVTSQPFDRIEIREVGDDGQNEVFGQFFTGALAKSWINAGSGNWDTGANWTGGTVPIATDFAFIAPSTAVTVAGPAAATTVAGLTVDNQGASATALNLQASGAQTVTNDVYLGQNGAGSVTVPNGGTLNVGGDTNIEASGTLRLDATSTFNPTGATNLNGGTLSVDSTSQLSGSPAFTWNAGTLAVTGAGGFSATGGGPLGATVNLTAGQTLDVTNTVTNAFSIDVSGGSLISSDIVNQSGLTLTVSAGTVDTGAFDNTSGGITNISGGVLNATSFDSSTGTLNFTGGTLSVDGGTFTPRTLPPGPNFALNAAGNPTLQLENSASTNIGGSLDVAGTDDGTLNILSGSTVQNTNGAIASTSAAGTGAVLVDGPGSTWTNTGTLNVGFGTTTATSDDFLTVSNGGAVIVNGTVTIGSTGAIALTGGSITVNNGDWVREASSQFHQFHTGGTLTINNGNFVSGTSTHVLNGAGRPEIVLTGGATHTGTNIDIINGEWHVLSGSTIDATTFQAFNNTGSGAPTLVEVDGAGSSITSSGGVNIGISGGDATLNVTDGGSFTVTANFFSIADDDNTIGVMTVDGTGSSLSVAGASGLFVGNEGQATLDVTNGGLVTTNILTVADSDTNGVNTPTSTMTVNGTDGVTPSTLNVTGSSFIGGSTNEDGGVGILNVQTGARYNSNGGIIGSGDNTGPDGTGTVNITGTDSFWNAIANGSNDIFVGDTGAGTLNVTAGGRVDADAVFIGDNAGVESAAMTIDGGTSVVNVRGSFVVGNTRRGTLELTNNAILNTSSTAAGGEFLIGNNGAADNSSVLVDNSSIIHNGTGRFVVGDDSNSNAGGPSTMTIQNGGEVTAAGSIFFVADQAGSTGNLILEDEGSMLTVGRMLMGDNGAGTATISNGADLIVNAPGTQLGNLEVSAFGGGTGTMTVTDTGSTVTIGAWLSVGDEGTANGTLNILNGASVSTAAGQHAYIARVSSTSTGVINVQDLDTNDGSSGSTLDVGANLYLGGNASGGGGDATLNVNVGGTVNVAGLLMLWDDGKVNLNGGTINTATFDLDDPAEVPQPDFTFNSGTFRYTAAATLNSETLDDLLGPGVPTLTAGKNLVVTDQATLSAPLRLDGGTLSVGSSTAASLANVDWDAGTLNITAQTLTVGASGQLGQSVVIDQDQVLNVSNSSNNITVDAGADLNVIRGALTSSSTTNDGLIVVSNTTAVDFDSDDAGAGLTNNGDLVAIDSTINGFFQNNGSIELIGAVSFPDGMSLAASSSLGFDIDGVSDFDVLTVGGASTLDGSLHLDVGFSLSAGDSFEIIDVVGTLTGTFAGLPDNALVGNFGGTSLFIDYDGGDGNDVVLFAGLAGDFDFDNDVDGFDFLVWQIDPNVGSLSDWEANYGTVIPLSAAATAVPEPSAGIMVVLGMVTVLAGRRTSLRKLDCA